MKVKVAIAVLTLSAIILAYSYGVTDSFNLSFLKDNQQKLIELVNQSYAKSLFIFSLIYIFSIAISLPGATILTLAGGLLFGFWPGLIIVSFASSVGATLAFLAARYLFSDWVKKRFGNRLKSINRGIEKEGAYYLFSLRLIPVFPFFLINVLMALTPIKTFTFYWVSQAGMLAGTAVYVNAGTQISKIDNLSDIMSLDFVISFILIGLFPLLTKKIMKYFSVKKLYKSFRRPTQFDYNIVVVGAGSAGLVTSYIASVLKAKVALIEKHKMGGDCLNTGCVPSKALIRSAKILNYASRAKDYGLRSLEADYEFAEVMERVQKIITQIEPHDSVSRYQNLGVECFEGTAQILSPFKVEVGGKVLTTRNIVIATGAKPLVPPLPGIETIDYLTSDTIWNLRNLPKKFIVIGGGPIGSELAQCFHRLGSEVIQIETHDCILNREDDDVSNFICKQFSEEGITVLTNHRAERIEVEGGKKYLICNSAEKKVKLEFDQILLAVGRRASVAGFGLEELGVQLSNNKTIATDPFLRTNYPNIYVAGDVAGPYQFTHVAAHQAWYATVNALFSPYKKFKVDYRLVPHCTFTDPEVAHVGLSEKTATAEGIDFEVTKYSIDDLDRAITDGNDQGFVKVITPKGKDKILGVTIVGTNAGDLLAEYILAMKHGLGLNKILSTIHTYPTMSEANKYAAGVWKREHAPERLMRWLEKFHTYRRR